MFYIELTLSVLGIVCLIFMLVILYRLFEVLELFRALLKSLIFHKNAFKETLLQIRKFCQKYSDPLED